MTIEAELRGLRVASRSPHQALASFLSGRLRSCASPIPIGTITSPTTCLQSAVRMRAWSFVAIHEE